MHLQVQDGPLNTGECRTVKESIPVGERGTPDACATELLCVMQSQTAWCWGIRHLEADQPPPLGLSAIRLRI